MNNWYEQYTAEAENPNWEVFDSKHKHIHDWRSYITDEVRENWFDISLIGRCALISCCEVVANDEEWE